MSRQPKCSRCRHHGVITMQKGHTKLCPFLTCDCWKCGLVAERTRIQRGLKKVRNNEQQKPAASAPCGDARPSGTFRRLCPRGVPERDTNNTCNPLTPLDLRSRPAGGGRSSLAGLQSMNGSSSEGETCTPFNAPNLGGLDQPHPALPVLHFPFWVPGHYSGSYALCPNFMLNMPWLPTVPPGLYNDALCGPLMFPHFQPGATYNPPPPEPGPPALSGLQNVPQPLDNSAPRDPPGSQTH